AVLAAVLLAAAFFTKQSYVAGIAALTLAALQGRQWQRAILLTAVWAACVGLGFAWLEWSTGGLFSRNVFAPNVVSMEPALAYAHVSAFILLSVPLLVLAALGWRSPWLAVGARRVLAWYAVLAAAMAMAALAKVGSNYNYLLELVAVLA